MEPLALAEIADLDAYEHLRPDYRQKVIALKKRRRVSIGDRITLVFENRETLRFQVQEMLRIERTHEPARVQRELDVYNQLLPGPDELSATLFIEIPDLQTIRAELDRLIGIDEHVALVLGEDDDECERIGADFDPDQMEDERISAVHYLRFRPTPAQVARLADVRVRARLRVDHPAYADEAEVSPALREALCADLAGEAGSLLSAEEIAAARAAAAEAVRDEVLQEGPGLRVVRPGRPRAPVHLIVEATDPEVGFASAEPALWNVMLDAVRRLASELTAKHGSCRIEASVSADETGLRWHLLAGNR